MYTEIGCNDHYLEETDRRIPERVLDHAVGDPNSFLFKHSVKTGHPILDMSNYKIIEKGHKKMLEIRKSENC